MKQFITACLVAIGAVALGIVGRAQERPASSPAQSFRAQTRVVPVYASVTDDMGHFVGQLTKSDFEVRDNGRLQEITYFTPDIAPINVVVLLDGSRSLLNGLDSVIAAADHFVVRLRPGDRAKVGSFSEEIRLNPLFTNDRDELSRQVNDLLALRLGTITRLWDAIEQAILSFNESQQQRVVVVFTDGDDTYSSTTFNAVLGLAHRVAARIYLVVFEGVAPLTEERPRGELPPLEDLSSRTGGGYYRLDAMNDLNRPSTRIAEELHSTYVLGFTPRALDGRVHKLDVKVKRSGLSVRARRDYVAVCQDCKVPPAVE